LRDIKSGTDLRNPAPEVTRAEKGMQKIHQTVHEIRRRHKTMKIEMTRWEAMDYMRACSAMVRAFRHECAHAETADQRERALRSEKMWWDRHELIKNALDNWDETHQK
jgi:hypothetical protein